MSFLENNTIKLVIILILSLLVNSCNEQDVLEKYDKNGNLIVYNEQIYAEMWTKDRNLKVTVIDTFCINQRDRAVKDIKKGKLVYFGYNNYEFEKISEILGKFGIESKKSLRRGVRLGGFEPYCYENEMHKEINRRFGKSFIDSISEIAKKEFIKENPNIDYIEDGVDLKEKYNIK